MAADSRGSSRRAVVAALASSAAGLGSQRQTVKPQPAPAPAKLTLEEFEPRSMLVARETKVTRARFPVIDVHTHVGGVFGRRGAAASQDPAGAAAKLEQIVRWMDELNIKTMINLTGGYGDALKQNIAGLDQRYPGRFLNCIVPAWERLREKDFPSWQAEELGRAKAAGAVGLKILKELGLGVREGGREGPLVKIDDPRLDPMWDAAGKLKMPVFIHTGDPDAFFIPIDRFNERWEELGNHPNWSFYGKDFPTKPELLAARNRVIARHTKTTFVGLHVANHPENLDEVSGWLKQYPNLHVEFGARLGELGRQPRRSRRFFEEFAGRIMFGTDASPGGTSVPQQDLQPAMFQGYFRFLETLDEYFDYAPSRVPPQGRWRIYGIGLPEAILKNVYHNNAARLLGWKTI